MTLALYVNANPDGDYSWEEIASFNDDQPQSSLIEQISTAVVNKTSELFIDKPLWIKEVEIKACSYFSNRLWESIGDINGLHGYSFKLAFNNR